MAFVIEERNLLGVAAADSHAVEGAVDEEEGHCKERERQNVCDGCALVAGKSHGQFHCEQSEKRGEFDDRVQGDGGSIFEGIAYSVTDHGGVMQRSSLLLHFDFDDLLGVVPGGAGIGHEDGLVEAEDGDRDQVAHEEEWFDEREGQRAEEDGDEDVQHAFLCVFRADLDYLFAVFDGGFFHAFEFDVGLDELDSAVSAGGDGLRGCAGEPVNHCAAGDQAEEERGVQEREFVHVFGEAGGERHDDGEDHGGGADYGGADEHWLRGGFESVACSIVGFEEVLGALEVHGHVEILFYFGFDVGNLLDQREFVDGWSVVGDRAVGIDGDGDWAHAEDAKGDESEGEYGGGEHGCRGS